MRPQRRLTPPHPAALDLRRHNAPGHAEPNNRPSALTLTIAARTTRELRGSGPCRPPRRPARRPVRRSRPSASPPRTSTRSPGASRPSPRASRSTSNSRSPARRSAPSRAARPRTWPPRCTRPRRAGTPGRGPASPSASSVLLRFHDLVLSRQEEILDLIQLESGKARKHAFEEVLDVAIVARYYANTAARAPEDAAPPRRAAGAHRRLRAPPPARRGGDHRAVELPAGAERQRRHARAGGRQRGDRQARQPDAVHGAVGLRPARGGRAAEGPRPGRHRARAPSSART